MPQSSASGQPKIIAALPDALLTMKRFLLWREFPGPNGKTRKTPFYASGEVRRGVLDTEADLAKLVTLDEAWDEYLLGDYAGIGFALSNDGVGAFDMDHCLTADGHLVKGHPGHDLILEAKNRGAYIEISPSGRGLRIVGPCLNPDAYSKGGLEYWGAKRFVTLTGDVWANPKGWVALDDLRAGVSPPKKPVDERDDDEIGIVTPRTIDELKSALNAIDAEERDLWVRMGMALKTLGPKGKALWLDWSATSKKFDKPDAERVWGSFEPGRTNHKAVFAEAQSNWNWQNPRSRIALVHDEEPKEDDEPRPSMEAIDLGEPKLLATEFVLDGFLPAQVSVIAGAWGAGKSTNLIPLLASVAHLSPAEWGFHPTLRRHVIWITEAPEQARDTLYSLWKTDGAADWPTIKEWFHLFPAKRKSAKAIARQVSKLVEELCWVTDNGFRVKPLVVLDTTTANIDLDNESDNSLVGAAMSTIKQTLSNTPIVLVGHTPKALVKSDVGDMTFRGAGAWEAEAAATFFLIYDQETDMRFLAIRKARFTPAYREIDFDHSTGSEIVDTPWGEPQVKSYLHGIPAKSTGEARKAARDEIIEERREEGKERTRTDRQERILAFVRSCAAEGRLATRASVREAIGGKKELAAEALERLFESGLVESHSASAEALGIITGRVPEILLPQEVSLELFLGRIEKATER